MKTDEIAISVVTAIFLVYVVFISFFVFPRITLAIFIVSPLLIIYLVYTVLRHGIFNGKELDDEQEFGYLDKPHLGKTKNLQQN